MQRRVKPAFQVKEACQVEGVWTTQASVLPDGREGLSVQP